MPRNNPDDPIRRLIVPREHISHKRPGLREMIAQQFRRARLTRQRGVQQRAMLGADVAREQFRWAAQETQGTIALGLLDHLLDQPQQARRGRSRHQRGMKHAMARFPFCRARRTIVLPPITAARCTTLAERAGIGIGCLSQRNASCNKGRKGLGCDRDSVGEDTPWPKRPKPRSH